MRITIVETQMDVKVVGIAIHRPPEHVCPSNSMKDKYKHYYIVVVLPK